MHSGEFVDTLAGYLAILVLIVVPMLPIYLFWIGVRADRLANRVALHLALGGGFAPPAAP